ncbi:hypothetical protein [Bradyrhizobium sp.]
MSISNQHNEHDEHPAYARRDAVQWLMIVAIVLSGAAVSAIWLYLHW